MPHLAAAVKRADDPGWSRLRSDQAGALQDCVEPRLELREARLHLARYLEADPGSEWAEAARRLLADLEESVG